MQQQQPAPEKILKYLQDPAVQIRLRQQLKNVHQHISISIGQAAKIMGITEVKLRYWETLGLLSPERTLNNPDPKASQGQRRYSLNQINRLIIINELLSKQYSLRDIDLFMKSGAALEFDEGDHFREIEPEESAFAIDSHSMQVGEALFWQFFTPRALYFSACLLFEDVPDGDVGIFLPVRESYLSSEEIPIRSTNDLRFLGNTLAGWHNRDYPFSTYWLTRPILEYPQRYSLFPVPLEKPLASDARTAYLVTSQNLRDLPRWVHPEAHDTARRFLKLLQDRYAHWKQYLQPGGAYTTYNPANPMKPFFGDRLLKEIAEIIVSLGGTDTTGEKPEPRWQFCCILLPKDPLLPVHQSSLVVQAQSQRSPHKAGVTTLYPGPQAPGLSLRAYQSGRISYRREIASEDPAIALQQEETNVRSAIAVPVEGGFGHIIAVLYVTSPKEDGFTPEDQRVLRIMGRMISELIDTYRIRSLAGENLRQLITHPDIVDTFFKEFRSENEFIHDLETILTPLYQPADKPSETGGGTGAAEEAVLEAALHQPQLSFIAIDIDNQSSLANKYGETAMRNLIRAVGERIEEQLPVLFTKAQNPPLYRIYADRFYLLLKQIALSEAVEHALQLKKVLRRSYAIDAARIFRDQSIPRESRLELPITVRLGVTSYSDETLRKFLSRAEGDVSNVIPLITRPLDEALYQGSLPRDDNSMGGDIVTAWNPKTKLLEPVPENGVKSASSDDKHERAGGT